MGIIPSPDSAGQLVLNLSKDAVRILLEKRNENVRNGIM